MRSIDKLRLRVRSLFRKGRVEQDLDDELRAHLAYEIDALMATGLSRAAARDRALRLLGGVDQVKEACRDRRRVSRLEHLWQDLRYAARLLRKSPAFTSVAVLSLAFGIGATTAIFSVVYAVLLRPLPYPAPDRLVLVRERLPQITPNPITMPAPDTREFSRAAAFEQAMTMNRDAHALSGVATPERLQAIRVSPSMFAMLGVTPVRGRAFTAAEDRPDHQVVLISHALWQRQFHGDPAIVGRAILLDRQPHQVIGVMPRDFTFPIGGTGRDGSLDLFLPLGLTPTELNAKGDNFDYDVIARLRAGVSLERARAEAEAIAARVHETYPADVRGTFELHAAVLPLFERVIGGSRNLLALLFGAVALLLTIACANVANMLLSRAAGRGRELALRRALGASRGRVVQQLLTESVLLALIGGILGAVVAYAGTDLLVRWLPGDLPRTDEVRVDAMILTFAIALSLVTGLLFGLAPALSVSRREGDAGHAHAHGLARWGRRRAAPASSVPHRDQHADDQPAHGLARWAIGRIRTRARGGANEGLQAALRESGKGTGGGAHGHRLRQVLAVTELALALVLLTGAGLLLRSFLVVLTMDPGFEPKGALSVSLALPETQYREPAQARAFYDRLLDDLGALPGVQQIGGGSDLPFQWSWLRIATRDQAPAQASGGEQTPVGFTVVHRRYFEALGIRLREGRLFDDRDRGGTPAVLLVNDAFARRFFPDRSAIGGRVKWGTPTSDAPWLTIVGVVSSVARDGPDREPAPQAFAPYAQMTTLGELSRLSVVLRVNGDPVSLMPSVRARIQALDPHLPLDSLRTLDDATARALAPRRMTAGLVSVFAVSAVLLAALGLYGVLAYAVGQRTQEFGIRLALGAAPRQVLGLVLGQGLALALTGVAIGLVLSAWLARAMTSLLFGIGPFDPGVMVGVPLTLLAIALVACVIPARRAVRVDPIRALRTE